MYLMVKLNKQIFCRKMSDWEKKKAGREISGIITIMIIACISLMKI